MRELKFRAWDKNSHKMYSVDYLEFKWKMPIHDTEPLSVGIGETDGYLSWDDVELMQYTGLKDKNGVEIYEGDILQWEHRRETVRGKVQMDRYRWEVAEFFIGWQDDPSDAFLEGHPLEVIGNIYENPELMSANES